MIQLRRAEERGRFDHGWLDTRHTFSFADYFDPAHMGFRSLRVLNEDRVRPGEGFGTHGHRDMEILTYVLSGALEHRDSLGHGGVLRRDRVQHMRAGTGIRHSEFNAGGEPLHFYQIWILPNAAGLEPDYVDKNFDPEGAAGRLQLLASPGGRDGSLDIAQDASWYRTRLMPGQSVSLPLAPGRHAWVQVAKGEISLGHAFTEPKNGMECAGEWTPMAEGDGAAVSGEGKIELRGEKDAEALIFDLA
jgi:redox-sensitive bicupin YhaK (pirin superfamily)